MSETWVSISEAARRTGVSAMAVSRRVRLLERDGLLQARTSGPGAPKLVDFDEFVRLAAATTDAVRSANSRLATPAREARKSQSDAAPTLPNIGDLPPVLVEEQARKTKLQADLAQIQLDKARGLLIPVADVEDAMTRAAGNLARALDALSTRAEEFAAVVAREGSGGLRAAIKAAVRELRERMAADMTAGSDGAEAV